jgi:hypothetical protein
MYSDLFLETLGISGVVVPARTTSGRPEELQFGLLKLA